MINPNSGRHTDAKVRGDLFDGMMEQEKRISEMEKHAPQNYDYPELLVELLNQFQEVWGIPSSAIPFKKQEGKYLNWVLQLENLRKLFSSDARMKIAMKYSFEKYQKSGKNLLIYEPASIYKILVDGISDLRRQERIVQNKEKSEKMASPDRIKNTVKDLKSILKEEEEQ